MLCLASNIQQFELVSKASSPVFKLYKCIWLAGALIGGSMARYTSFYWQSPSSWQTSPAMSFKVRFYDLPSAIVLPSRQLVSKPKLFLEKEPETTLVLSS